MRRNDCNSDTSSEDEDSTRRKSANNRNNGAVKSNSIVPRPNASAGYWLCCLLPLAFAVAYLPKAEPCSRPEQHEMLTIAAWGMCVESLCYFLYLKANKGFLLKLLIALVPGTLTASGYRYILQYSWTSSAIWGFAITFGYQSAYIHAMYHLPRSFTYGEASVLVQGLMLFVLNSGLVLPPLLLDTAPAPEQDEFTSLNTIMMNGLFCLLIFCLLVVASKGLRRPVAFYILMTILVVAVTCLPITNPLPVVTLFNYILQSSTRLNIILFYLVLVVLTVITVWWQVRNTQRASTRVRKIFHLLIVLVYLPGLLYQCTFLYIASGVALAVITVLELIRVLEVPPLSQVLESGFSTFSDGKDAGVLALTPFCLLIGCSLPIWLHPCPCSAPSVQDGNRSMLPLLAGILTVGFGDSAASVIGSKFGHIKWRNSSRSLEGSVAFVIAIGAVITALYTLDYMSMSLTDWFVAFVATTICALIEAHTDQIDNLILPLVFYIIVSVC